jgi:hypothetical protein
MNTYSRESCIFVTTSVNNRNKKTNLSFYVIYKDKIYEFFTNTGDFIDKNDGFTQSTISNCVYNKINTYRGLMFVSVEEFQNNTIDEIIIKRSKERSHIKYPIIATSDNEKIIINNPKELIAFALKNNLNKRRILDYMQGRRGKYLNWDFISKKCND